MRRVRFWSELPVRKTIQLYLACAILTLIYLLLGPGRDLTKASSVFGLLLASFPLSLFSFRRFHYPYAPIEPWLSILRFQLKAAVAPGVILFLISHVLGDRLF